MSSLPWPEAQQGSLAAAEDPYGEQWSAKRNQAGHPFPLHSPHTGQDGWIKVGEARCFKHSSLENPLIALMRQLTWPRLVSRGGEEQTVGYQSMLACAVLYICVIRICELWVHYFRPNSRPRLNTLLFNTQSRGFYKSRTEELIPYHCLRYNLNKKLHIQIHQHHWCGSLNLAGWVSLHCSLLWEGFYHESHEGEGSKEQAVSLTRYHQFLSACTEVEESFRQL